MTEKQCYHCDEKLVPGDRWPEEYQEKKRYIHRDCDNVRPGKTRRHFCTLLMPDGTIRDWVRFYDQDTPTNKGGKTIAHWFQDRPGDNWPSRKELLTGVLTKPPMKTCNGCEIAKQLSEFNKKTDSTQPNVIRLQAKCKKCQTDDAGISGALKQRACNRLGLTGGDNTTNNMTGWRDYSLEQRTTWLAEQDKIDKEKAEEEEIEIPGDPKEKEPNQQAAPPKEKKIPPSKLRAPGTTKTPTWNQSATSKALAYNLCQKHGGCEYTSAPPINCNESHVLARWLCRKWDHPEWVDMEENCIYIQAGLNDAMERAGYWLHPEGWFAPPVNGDYAPWIVTLGIPQVRIQMYGLRAWFATMAMRGEIVPQFTGAPFVKPPPLVML